MLQARTFAFAIMTLAATLSVVATAEAQQATPIARMPVVGPAVTGIAAPIAGPVTAPIASVRQSEAAIRQQPLLERPNRFGHFYGNTIRRRHYGTLNVNRGRTSRPLAQYFYLGR